MIRKFLPLLALVALGTVADVVRLDANNRRLVAQGLKRIRAGQMPAGVAALFHAAGRKAQAATTFVHTCKPPRERGRTWSIVSARALQ